MGRLIIFQPRPSLIEKVARACAGVCRATSTKESWGEMFICRPWVDRGTVSRSLLLTLVAKLG